MSGNASFAVTLSVETSAGQVVTATATDPNGNTSEFSACQSVAVGQQFFTVAPCRAVDTRDPVGALGGPALTPQSARTFALAGACGIPASAKSVAVNLTVTQPAAPGTSSFIPRKWPSPCEQHQLLRGADALEQRDPSALDGWIRVVAVENAAAGSVHFILDVSGYFE